MRTRITILTLAVLLTVPALAGAWGAKGDNEPSTKLDKDGGFMFDTANTAAVNKVYFNGWLAQQPCWNACLGTPVGVEMTGSVNPNVASLGSAFMGAPSRAYAMLGIWRDCNGDGYVGFGDQGLYEYPAQLLTLKNAGNCPVTAYPAIIPRNFLPPHNDGKLVREFLPIGYDSMPGSTPCSTTDIGGRGLLVTMTCQDFNPFDVNDSGAYVWQDFGNPGDQAGNICYVSPHPQGTYQSVGGLQRYADCFAQNRIYDNISATPAKSTYDANKGYDCEHSSILGAYHSGCNPWGTSGQEAYVSAFDCSSKAFRGKDADPVAGGPTNEKAGDGRVLSVWLPNVSQPRGAPTTNYEGSMAGTINETEGSFDDCRQNDEGNSTARNLPYNQEADILNTNGVRLQHDTIFRFDERARPAPGHGFATTAVLGRQVADDGGVGFERDADFWIGNGIMLASRNPYVARDELKPAPVTNVTYYAHVSPTAVASYGLLLPHASAKYGAEACAGGIGAGKGVDPASRWACDPDAWWPGFTPCGNPGGDQCDDRSGTPRPAYVRVGADYELRDIDCYDASITALRNEGVTYHSLAASGSKCI